MPNHRDIDNARKNRQEIVKAGLTRRDLLELGLLTGAGYLVAKKGLSSRAWADGGGGGSSPPTRSFIVPLTLLTVKQPVSSLSPAPTIAPNTAGGEGRTVAHQALTRFPPAKLYQVVQRQGTVSMSPDLPMQTIWGFDGISPGPVYHAHYGEPILVRNINNLPSNNQGFGNNTVTTHLH